jgi:glutathione S-transferase
MKLYYAPQACSLADHIALIEAGLSFETEAVDIHSKRTQSGKDFYNINPKGYVPALVLDDGQTITENIAVLDWIAEQYPPLRPAGALARTRTLEMLTFISTEIHRAFKPMWHGAGAAEKAKARETVAGLLQLTAGQMRGGYLLGDTMSVADCYLFVMLRWAERFDVAVPETLLRLRRRMESRPSVRAALEQEEPSPAGVQPRRPRPTEVRENPEQHRFERPIDDEEIAAAYYRHADGTVEFIHTDVPTEWSGQGIATDLARGTFELLRQSGRKATLRCPFMVRFVNAHPEYADIVVG